MEHFAPWYSRIRTLDQGRNRHIFLRGQSYFSWFFFPVENSHFGRPKTNSRCFKKWKSKKKKKKKKKKSSPLFRTFYYFHFQFSTFPFTIFLLFFSIFTPFPFFPCLIFPDTSAKISRSEVSGGQSAPCPTPVMPLPWIGLPFTLATSSTVQLMEYVAWHLHYYTYNFKCMLLKWQYIHTTNKYKYF